MDRKQIDDSHVVARYLADQLTDDERAEFEAYLREHPELVDEIEATARFKVGLAALEARGEMGSVMRPQADWRARALALAAAVAVLAVGVAFWMSRTPAPGPLLAASADALLDSAGRALPVTEPVAIFRTRRRAPHDAVVALPIAPSAIALRVLPEYPAAGGYRLSISRVQEDDAEPALATLSGLLPDEDGFLSVYVRSESLTPGIYALHLESGEASDESAYSIEVTALPTTD